MEGCSISWNKKYSLDCNSVRHAFRGFHFHGLSLTDAQKIRRLLRFIFSLSFPGFIPYQRELFLWIAPQFFCGLNLKNCSSLHSRSCALPAPLLIVLDQSILLITFSRAPRILLVLRFVVFCSALWLISFNLLCPVIAEPLNLAGFPSFRRDHPFLQVHIEFQDMSNALPYSVRQGSVSSRMCPSQC